MNIIIEHVQPTSEVAIQQVEELTGLRLSEPYRAFVLQYNGGVPRINGALCLLKIDLGDGHTTETFIESFVSMKEVVRQWEYMDYLASFANHFELDAAYVEEDKLFPVANLASGAAYIALAGRHAGKIYTADNGDFGILYHSPSFDDFLASLYRGP